MYKWKYIYLIPESVKEELTRGEKIHKYLENITLIGFNGRVTKDKIISGFEDNYTKDCIKNFLNSDLWDFSEIKSLLLEQLFYWKVKNYFIVGKLDRVDMRKDNKMRVIDYKISKHLRVKKNISKNQSGNLHSFQLKAYIAALSEIYKKPVEDITGFLFYLEDGVDISVSFKSNEIEKFKQDILGIINNILSNNFNGALVSTCSNKKCCYAEFCSHTYDYKRH